MPCIQRLGLSMVESAMVMISADRMKSVLIAPATLSSSSCAGSLGSKSALIVSSACGARTCTTFSAPSKHRYAPPSIRSGGITWGRK